MQSIYSKNFKLGLLGGGQLGRMLIQEAINLDVHIHCLDPSPEAPCSAIASGFKVGDFNNYEDVLAFGKTMDLISIEIEHVNVLALEELERLGKKVYPQSRIIKMIQDKGAQKLFYQKHGFPTAPFKLVSNADEFEALLADGPCVQKVRSGGYDGRGVQVLKGTQEKNIIFDAPSVWEEKIDIEKELAVIVARNYRGEVQYFPAVSMVFNPKANLVEYLYAPADISDKVSNEVISIASEIIEKLEMVGLLAVEFFLDKKGQIWVNEMAPRPHNSGHHTIEGNLTSQYGQHLRSILNLPLGETTTIKPSVMFNLLGEPGYSGVAKYIGIEKVLNWPGVFVHLYGKKETKPFRKMGHVTVLNDDPVQLKELIHKVKKTIKIIA